MWFFFCRNHFRQQKRLKIHIRGCKWVKYQCNLFLFYPFRIIKAVFNRLNLRLSQRITHLDTFLKKLCSRPFKVSRLGYMFMTFESFFLSLSIFHWYQFNKFSYRFDVSSSTCLYIILICNLCDSVSASFTFVQDMGSLFKTGQYLLKRT